MKIERYRRPEQNTTGASNICFFVRRSERRLFWLIGSNSILSARNSSLLAYALHSFVLRAVFRDMRSPRSGHRWASVSTRPSSFQPAENFRLFRHCYVLFHPNFFRCSSFRLYQAVFSIFISFQMVNAHRLSLRGNCRSC